MGEKLEVRVRGYIVRKYCYFQEQERFILSCYGCEEIYVKKNF